MSDIEAKDRHLRQIAELLALEKYKQVKYGQIYYYSYLMKMLDQAEQRNDSEECFKVFKQITTIMETAFPDEAQKDLEITKIVLSKRFPEKAKAEGIDPA